MTPSIVIIIPYGFNDRLMNFPEFTLGRLLARNGWKVTGIARKEAGEESEQDTHGIHVYRYGGSIGGALRVLFLCIAARPDVIHVHMLRNNRVGAVSATLARLFGITLVFSEAGLLHDHYLVEDRDDPLGKPILYGKVARKFSIRGFRNYFFHFALTHADTAVFYSRHNIAIARALGIQDVRYIPLIVDCARLLSEAPTRDKLATLPSEAFALFIGQMKARKGWDILLRSVPLIERTVLPAFVFVSSSSRSETSDFVALGEELSVRERVRYVGSPSSADLRRILQKCALVVVPSRYEGFGLVPVEAFEAERPVVASGVAALTDYLVHGDNAYLVEPKDPEQLAKGIMDVMRDPALRERLVEGGRKTLAAMKSDSAAGAWLDFYRSMLRR